MDDIKVNVSNPFFELLNEKLNLGASTDISNKMTDHYIISIDTENDHLKIILTEKSFLEIINNPDLTDKTTIIGIE